MRNFHFVAAGYFSVNPGWPNDTHTQVRSILTNSLYTLFETSVSCRKLSLTTPSEKRVLVAFRKWYLRMRRREVFAPFVYVNVTTGKSIVLTIENDKRLLVDPRFFPWENIAYQFVELGEKDFTVDGMRRNW